jgi:hypothetical protein
MGVRFDDRVTGKLEAFAQHARIVHIDIDPAEIDKNKTAHIPICAGAAWSRGRPCNMQHTHPLLSSEVLQHILRLGVSCLWQRLFASGWASVIITPTNCC